MMAASAAAVDWHAFIQPVKLSLLVALIASILTTACGTLIAWQLSKRRFRGKSLLETAFMLPMVLPPTVVGFLLLLLLGRRSWLGRLIEQLFSQPIIFTWPAAVIASVIVSFPLVYQTMKVGFASIDRDLEAAGRSMGGGEWQIFRYITLPLVSGSLLAAYVLSFARSLGEFGATLMIAGNIPGKTQTVPTAIYVAVESGNMPMAWLWTGAVIAISFVLLLATGRGGRKE
ncbi:molybdate ABC transporter permease subunit [Paenibacillus protaetiae]|uniref:Molybdenum transport system permease n=1 Tax=Paenibacillus protaetiae TaxID=2509456 RepID=A0A4P6F2E5_9BACL|nr:molybdate ABC transporter permease subunit [Paenibacillus protaetiae]QAY67257.1 molybdate ABC transporter permease subunit [Paenibacillus protaetiae]